MIIQPYKSLDYYDTEDAKFFFGRQKEIKKLTSLIYNHRLVILYGTSGAGKTSLLLAGMGVVLEQLEKPYTLIHVRALEDPVLAIQQAVQRRLPAENSESNLPVDDTLRIDLSELHKSIIKSFNIDELKVLCSYLNITYDDLDEGSISIKALGLISYFQRRSNLEKLINICFDMRPKSFAWINKDEKTILKHPSAPPSSNLVDFLNDAAQSLNTTLVIALDQFEELFIRFSKSKRESFFSQLGAIYNATDIPVKLILSLRDDWLAYIDEIEKYIPEIFYIKMRLLPLSRQQARLAITGPIANLEISYEPALVEQLLQDLTNEETVSSELQGVVMPPQLQLVCNALFEQAQLSEKKVITLEDYNTLKGARGILKSYLEEELRRFPRSEMLLAKAVLEELGRPERTEKTVTCDELALILDESSEVLSSVIKKMVRSRLVRPLNLSPITSYELVHQYLVHEIETPREARTRKAVEELVKHELRNWQTLGTLIGSDRLMIISEWQDHLDLSQEAKQLIDQSLEKKDLDEQEQFSIIQSDKISFLNQLVAGIDKEISSPIASIESNSHFLHEAVTSIKEVVIQIPELIEYSENIGLDQTQKLTLLKEKLTKVSDTLNERGLLNDLEDISEELKQASKQMTHLIKALSNFAQRDEWDFEQVDIQTNLNAALLLMEHQTIKHRIKVEARLENHLTVSGSPSQLIQMFMNVIMNSIELLNSSKTPISERLITINTYIDDKWSVIIFNHNGHRFESHEFYDLFKFELDQKAKSTAKFGLTIAYQIVKRHQGSITVNDDKNKLARLTIKLPTFVQN